jgi:hypothetical protein
MPGFVEFGGSIEYAKEEHEVKAVCVALLEQARSSKKHLVLGFDMEW